MKGVFDTRAGTIYDDDITTRYHFPDRYLRPARACVGDWVLYREPRRAGGRSGYVAAARVITLASDRSKPGFSFAEIESFMDFDTVVRLDGPNGPYEEGLRGIEASRRGVALQGRSIRTISAKAFGGIVRAGLESTLADDNSRRVGLEREWLDPATRDLIDSEPIDQERRVEAMLVNRTIRDAAFRGQVIAAYDGRCAVTGLRMINGGGKAEAQAAHIWAVKDGGPDTVRNGIALSATVHWLFDRHLISLSDDHRLLVAHNRVPSELRQMFARQLDRVLLPSNPAHHPHPGFIRRHRDRFVGTTS